VYTWGRQYDTDPEEEPQMSYQAQVHAEWHYNAGVPAGPYGGSCPWDACGYAHDWDYEAELEAERQRLDAEEHAPALREGEEPAPPLSYSYGPAMPIIDPWTGEYLADEPPF
jgi:hypothetical protein